MPREYELPGGYDSLWQPTPADRIIGSSEAKRSTKSYMPDAKFAILLASIRNHAETHARAVQELDHDEAHAAEEMPCDGFGCSLRLTYERLADKYPGVRAWFNIHQEVVEHMASHEGFTLRVVAKLTNMAEEARREAESSVPSAKEAPRRG